MLSSFWIVFRGFVILKYPENCKKANKSYFERDKILIKKIINKYVIVLMFYSVSELNFFDYIINPSQLLILIVRKTQKNA